MTRVLVHHVSAQLTVQSHTPLFGPFLRVLNELVSRVPTGGQSPKDGHPEPGDVIQHHESHSSWAGLVVVLETGGENDDLSY